MRSYSDKIDKIGIDVISVVSVKITWRMFVETIALLNRSNHSRFVIDVFDIHLSHLELLTYLLEKKPSPNKVGSYARACITAIKPILHLARMIRFFSDYSNSDEDNSSGINEINYELKVSSKEILERQSKALSEIKKYLEQTDEGTFTQIRFDIQEYKEEIIGLLEEIIKIAVKIKISNEDIQDILNSRSHDYLKPASMLANIDNKLASKFLKRLEGIGENLSFLGHFIFISGSEYIEENNDFSRLINAFDAMSVEKRLQDVPAIMDFLIDHYEGTLSNKANIARVIFIGPGGSGKTSLIKALNGKLIIEGKEKPTPGISISDWKVYHNDSLSKVDVRIWDFAGQVTTHAMHKFFLRERCLYLLLLTTRDDQDLENQAEYWLEHIKLYGNGAPTLVIANKIDIDGGYVDFNEQDLKEKYPFILSFVKIAASKWNSLDEYKGKKYNEYFREFRRIFEQSIEHVLNQYKNELTIEASLVKNEIVSLREEMLLSYNDFKSICIKNGVESKRVNDLLAFFNNLGIITQFPELDEDTILNPVWLSYGVYEVLDLAGRQTPKGWVKTKLVKDHLKKGLKVNGETLRYPVAKINNLIIGTIEAFNLGYKFKRGLDEYLVLPSVLDKRPAKNNFRKERAMIHFIYKFDVLLPPYILYSFISQQAVTLLRDYYLKGDRVNTSLTWQTGIVLTDQRKNKLRRVKTLVERYTTRTIDIYIDVPELSTGMFRRKSLAVEELNRIVTQIDDIIYSDSRINAPQFKKYIEIPKEYYEVVRDDQGERFADYDLLLDRREHGEEYDWTSYGRFSISNFFGDYTAIYLNKKKSQTTIINNSGNINIGDINTSAYTQNTNENTGQIIESLSQFIDIAEESQLFRKEVRKLNNLLEDILNYPEELEKDDFESTGQLLQDKNFLEALNNSTTSAVNLVSLGKSIWELIKAYNQC